MYITETIRKTNHTALNRVMHNGAVWRYEIVRDGEMWATAQTLAGANRLFKDFSQGDK